MEKDRSSKIIAIIALFVAVIGLSLGFATFSSQLTISPAAVVRPDSSNFKVQFSNTAGAFSTQQKITPTLGSDATAEDATLKETTIEGIKAHFTKPGQSVTYNFYVYNGGSMPAYLKEVKIGDKTCTPTTDGTNDATDTEKVNAACNGITVTVTVDNDNYTSTSSSLVSKELSVGTGKAVKVKIEADKDAFNVDGDYDVTIGDITLEYRSNDANA